MATKADKKDSEVSLDIATYKIVAEHFNQDLREYWNKANFYLVTNAGIFSAFMIAYPELVENHLLIVLVMPFVGMAIAILWFLVLRGAMYWIGMWRQEMIKLSKELDRFQCILNVEVLTEEHRFLSSSYLTKFLPIVFLLAWVAILGIVVLEIVF